MSRWFSDVLKIACGVCLGYVLLIIAAFVFDDVFLPAIRVLAGWVTGGTT
jgi:hypothetical protein